MHTNKRLEEVARRQYGYFCARQAVVSGYAKDLQSYHAKCGNWKKVDRGLYRLPGYPDSLESEFVRYTLWAEGQSRSRIVAISHASALHYYGLSDTAPLAIHLSASSLKKAEALPGCVLHWETLKPAQLREGNGFRVTAPQRTLQDMRPDLVLNARWQNTVRMAVSTGLLTEAEGAALLPEQPESGYPALSVRGLLRERPEAESLYPTGEQAMNIPATLRPAGRNTPRQWTGPVRSFTLVEMLVVISVIAVLASLLMPSLAKSLETARTTQCRSNLHQVAAGLFSYADSNNGFIANYDYSFTHGYVIPPLNWILTANAGPLVYLTTQGYVPGFQRNNTAERPVTTCPTYWPAYPIEQNWEAGYPQNAAYKMGGTYAFNCHVDQTLTLKHALQWKKFTTLQRPSQRFVFGEGTWAQCRVFASDEATAWANWGVGAIWWGHNGASNFQYADGHVSTLSPDTAGYSDNWPKQANGADTTLPSPW